MIKNEFDNEVKYKLFRNVQEILHPVISKKNISNYIIVVEENILPVRVFYPQKVSNISKIMIYIHGNGKITECYEKYSDICKDLAMKTNSLVIALEYEETPTSFPTNYYAVYDTIAFFYERLEKDDIDTKNIILVGDSTGANIITGLNYLNHHKLNIEKEILFYPVLSSDYKDTKKYDSFVTNFHFNPRLLNYLDQYFSEMKVTNEKEKELLNPLLDEKTDIPKTLVFVGKTDLLKDEIAKYKELHKEKVEYVELSFAEHGFLKSMDSELKEELFEKMNEFIL